MTIVAKSEPNRRKNISCPPRCSHVDRLCATSMVSGNGKSPAAKENRGEKSPPFPITVVSAARSSFREACGARSRSPRPVSMLWRTGPAGPALPVPPVLSGRDQASATPSIAISHPLTGTDARRLQCEYGDCMIIYMLNPAESTGNRRTAGLFVETFAVLPALCERKCMRGLPFERGWPGGLTVQAAAMAEAGFAEPKPSRRISHELVKQKSSTVSAAGSFVHNSSIVEHAGNIWSTAPGVVTNAVRMTETLYIIGNGFDLQHGIRSSYKAFGEHLKSHDRDTYNVVERHLGVSSDFWAEFEEGLAELDTDSVIDYASSWLKSYDAEDWSDAYHHDYQYEINRVVQAISATLRLRFGESIGASNTSSSEIARDSATSRCVGDLPEL